MRLTSTTFRHCTQFFSVGVFRLLFALAGLSFVSLPASAAVLSVPAQYTTIQAAINASSSGDTVLIADGTYTGPGNVDLDFGGKNITVTSQHGAASAIIDCGASASANHRGFYLHSGETNAVISGLTIENGYEFSPGGGISVNGVGVILQSCIVKNNVSNEGGGIAISGTSGNIISVVNCSLTGNTAVYGGGGIYNFNAEYNTSSAGSTVTITNCTLTGNSALNGSNSGAGLYNAGYGNPLGVGTITLTNDILYGDTGSEVGGVTGTSGNCDIQGGAAGTGNINTDPLFVASPSDLHLQAGSSCLGAGTGSGTPSTTLDGRTRPKPPSIGAYEAVVSSATLVTSVRLSSSSNPSVIGSGVTFTAAVIGGGGSPTGIVTFSVDGNSQGRVTLSGGKASYVTATLPAGMHVIRAAYSGDAAFVSSTSPVLTQTVNTASTTTSLTTSQTPISYGQALTFTATVTGGLNPTGTVILTDTTSATTLGTATLATTGSVTFTIYNLSGGSHQITAAYGGDSSNSASVSAALTQTITQVATTTTLSSNLSPSIVGQSVTFTTTVTASAYSPTGTLVYTVDGVMQAPVNYNRRYTTASLTAGSHTISVAYSGDSNFTPSASSTLTQIVVPHVSPQYVSPTGSDSNIGTLAAPKLTIQAAIDVTLSGDTILITDGTYTGLGNVDLDFGRRNITVTTQNGAATTIIDCGVSDRSANHRAFIVHDVTSAIISGLTIENGYESGSSYTGADSGYGGGIYNISAGLTVQNCVFKNNTAGDGGGMSSNVYTGTLNIINCLFIGNAAIGSTETGLGSGGGIYNQCQNSGGTLTGGTIQMTGCTLSNNTASDSGGGIYNFGGTRITETGCIVYENSAPYGGGVYNISTGTVVLVNCVVSYNASPNGNGGGIYNNNQGSGPFILTNCTIAANSAPAGGGGGLYNAAIVANTTSFLTNDLLYDDIGGEISGGVVTTSYCDILGGYAGTGNLNADPLFVSTAYDLHLQPGSPCLGAGTGSVAPNLTIDGRTRPNPPSIGAYEVFVAPTAVTVPTVSGTAGQTVTLSAALSNPGGAAVSGRTLSFSIDGTAVGTAVTNSAGAASLPYAIPATASTGGHTIAVSFTGDATDSASSGVGTLTVAAAPAAVQINAGGGVSGTFAADTGFSGGNSYATNAAISTSGVANAAPQAVYRTERYGNFTYTVSNLTPGASYTLRLHFAEIYWQSAGQRLFNVTVNGATVLSNFDIFAAAGGGNRPVVETFLVTADSLGKVTLVFTTLRDNAKLSGLEILPAPAPQTTLAQINAGGGASGTFAADTDFSGGSTYATNAAIDTSGVTSPAPQAAYQTERYGNFTYTVPNLTPGASYTLRLHFAEIYWQSAGQRLFNVTVNGATVLSNFDIFAAAGGGNKAVVETFSVNADSNGKVTLVFTTVRDNAKLSGLELLQ